MKHIKTFESFNNTIGEGLLNDTLDKVKRYSINPDSVKFDLNKQNRNWMTRVLNTIDTSRVKFMQVFDKKKTKTLFDLEQFLKMVEDLDNFNGRLFIENDTVYYKPITQK